MNKPFVSIVIPAFNSSSTLGMTIDSCLLQDYPKDRFEVIVVDDGSTDNTADLVKKFPVKYLYQKKSGPAQARNNGWRGSKGEWVCFIDADCIPSKDWASRLVGHADKHGVGAVAGSYDAEGSVFLLDKFIHHEIRFRHSGMPIYINSFGTYNVTIKRDVLEELKGFDPLYSHASGEDSDLSYRIIKAGHRIYFEKRALVSHKNILKLRKYIAVQFRHGYWRMRLYRKNITMIARDEYGYWKDFVEAGLVILSMLLMFSGEWAMVLAMLSGLFCLQLPLAFRITIDHRDIRYLFFSVITFIRSFVRVTGGILGFIVFWITRKR